MAFIHSIIKTFSPTNNCEIWAYLSYPKLVLIERAVLRLLDVDKDGQEQEIIFPDAVIDKIIQQNFLWVILENNEIFVVDVTSGAKVKVLFNNAANYQFRQFKTDTKHLYLISKSEECLIIPFSFKELNSRINQEAVEITITLEKNYTYSTDLQTFTLKSLINGLDLYHDSGKIILECPMTGIKEEIIITSATDFVVSWDEFIIIASNFQMWIVDIKDGNVIYQFETSDKHYYPLIGLNNRFYYLQWNEDEIGIGMTWNNCDTADLHTSLDLSSNPTSRTSSQDFLKQQLQILIESPMFNTEPLQVLNQLLQLFGKVEDLSYLINTACKLCQNNLEFKSLLYPLQNRVNVTQDTNLIFQISDIIIKIDLLEYISFRQIELYNDKNLINKDCCQLIVTFLKESDIDLACICWIKYTEIQLKLQNSQITEILNVIPHNIKLSGLIIWLRNFVPCLLDENPFYIDLFVRWTTERVFLLEQSVYWPKVGIKFIEEIQNVLLSSLKTIIIRPISMDDLDMLKNHINDIKELKEKYKINMLLGELSSQRPDEISLIMLRRCYNEDLTAFIENYLPSYAARYYFDLDNSLRSYIENDTATSGGGVDSLRLHILLNSFRSVTSKLECLLSVLKVLDVPWDSTVLDLAVAAAASPIRDYTLSESDRILAFEIQKEFNYSKVKVILKKYNFPLTTSDYTLVLHKLMNSSIVDTADLRSIASNLNSNSNYGSLMYINKCLRECETRLALDYFENLPQKEQNKMIKAIVCKFEHIIDSCTHDVILERNYLDFLKGTSLLSEIQINTLENMYHLKNSYGTKMKVNDLYNEKYCNKQINCSITSDEDAASSGRGGCLTQLIRTHQTQYASVIAALRRISSSTSVKKFVEMLIVSNLYPNLELSQCLSSIMSTFKDGQNSSFLSAAFNVLIEVTENCREETLHDITKALSQLNILLNNIIVMKNLSVTWKYHYVYLSMPSIAVINDLIQFYSASNNYNQYIEDNIENICSRSDLVALNLAANVSNLNKDCESKLIMAKEKNIKKYILKIISSQEIDLLLVTNLLILLSNSGQEKNSLWILDVLQGPNEIVSPSVSAYISMPIVRRAFCIKSILSPNRALNQPHYILKSKFNLNLADVALPDITEETWDVKVVLFYVLKQYPDSTFNRVVELSRALNISINDGLSLQLVALLSSWELKYKLIKDDLGCRQIQFMNDEKDLINKCLKIWENIRTKKFIIGILTDLWKYGEVTLHGRLVSINPYYYEVYFSIYYLLYGSSIESRPMKEYYLLNFLKMYRRKGSPKQYEFELFSVKGMLPEIGKYRLPFNLFMRDDMWANLRSEIILESYEYWLPAVSLLSLDSDLRIARDMICSNALKQTMTSRNNKNTLETDLKDSEPWRLITREEPLLRAAHRCARHIANMEWAGACLFYVLQGCARGADQVAAAQLCYQFAQRWASLQPGNRAVRQMERLHCTLSTRHALHKIEWAREEFLRLSPEPVQLIRALYLHPDFVEKISRHDVNRAANEIADKNGINISSIRIQILEGILDKTNEECQNKSCLSLNAKELVTAKYILKATCPKMGAIYLSRIAFDDESDYNRCKKLRALQCLLSILEPETAMKVTYQERDTLWSCLLDLLYVVNLEKIDLPWIVATFAQDKVNALEQLLQSIGGNVEGLKVASELARRYGTISQIQNIIPHLLRASLHEEIVPLLSKASRSDFTNLKISETWHALLLSPFQRADYPITDRQRTKCIDALNLLPVCPVINEKDLIEIWKHCIRLKCYGIGCLLLPYMTENTRKTLAEINKIDKRNLIANLKNLQTETFLVSGAMFVLEHISSRSYR